TSGPDPQRRFGQMSVARRISMREVAELAGVHISTASRALDPIQRWRISSPTTMRVLAAAEQLGYVRDMGAEGLKRGQTKTVGFVVSAFTNPSRGRWIRGTENVSPTKGFLPLVAETGESEVSLEPILRHFVGRRVDAIVTTAVRSTDAPLLRTLAESG